jgi:5'-nucleotidase
MSRRIRISGVGCAVLALGLAAAACSSSPAASSASTTSTTSSSGPVLSILVTNDDGVGAPGIDAVVQGLRALAHTEVTVVAPATNESGTGGKTTAGTLSASRAQTASGYLAWAVHGYPADTIAWAIDQHGISSRPDLVVSGINFGENIGPLASVSGTVGAALAAVHRHIPALAASQGVDNGAQPAFSQGVAQVDRWVQSHRAALVAHRYGSTVPQGNLNIPTCVTGEVRGPVDAPLATSLSGVTLSTVNCSASGGPFADDAAAFVHGYAVVSPL